MVVSLLVRGGGAVTGVPIYRFSSAIARGNKMLFSRWM
jgi:hypothetical protein